MNLNNIKKMLTVNDFISIDSKLIKPIKITNKKIFYIKQITGNDTIFPRLLFPNSSSYRGIREMERLLTRQPPSGRSVDGSPRFGELEMDATYLENFRISPPYRRTYYAN